MQKKLKGPSKYLVTVRYNRTGAPAGNSCRMEDDSFASGLDGCLKPNAILRLDCSFSTFLEAASIASDLSNWLGVEEVRAGFGSVTKTNNIGIILRVQLCCWWQTLPSLGIRRQIIPVPSRSWCAQVQSGEAHGSVLLYQSILEFQSGFFKRHTGGFEISAHLLRHEIGPLVDGQDDAGRSQVFDWPQILHC